MKIVCESRILLLSIMLMPILVACAISNTSTQSTFSKPNNIGNHFGNLMQSRGFMAFDNENIYYMSFSNNKAVLTKTDLNGNKTPLLDALCLQLNVVDDWIYYVSGDDFRIYKIDTNGNNKQLINNELTTMFIYVYNNLIYVVGSNDNRKSALYTLSLNGTDLKCLSEDNIETIFIDKSKIYYTTYKEYTKLIRMDLDGENKFEIKYSEGEHLQWFYVYENTVYYCNPTDYEGIKKFHISEDTHTVLDLPVTYTKVIIQDLMNFKDNILIYEDFSDRTLNRLDMDTDVIERTRVKNTNNAIEYKGSKYYTNLYIIGEQLYFYDDTKIYMMDFDGNNKKLFD